MCPDIICLGELLVEIMRTEHDTPHGSIGNLYRGPYPSGAPAIFINSAARMGKPFNISTGFIGVVGNDEFGKCITKKLELDGTDISKIQINSEKTTGIAFNQYNSDGSRKFIFAPGAAGETSPDDIQDVYFRDIKSLHIMGSALSISESSKEACYKAIKVAQNANPDVIISFDPNLRPQMLDIEQILKICDPILKTTKILFPSGEEAELIAGVNEEKNACQMLLDNGIKIVILKRGKNGCTFFSQEYYMGINVPGFKINEIDPTGAGDSFDGAFIVGYLNGWDLRMCSRFANAVGALKVQHFGPMTDDTYDNVMKLIVG
ncbi:MAG: sugar kinase [Promethearchaeota archaeon]